MATTKNDIVVRLTTTSSSYGSLPLNWANMPRCPVVVMTATSPVYTYSPAVIAWYKAAEPQFRIALFNNFQIRPDSFGQMWEFPPKPPQKHVTYTWSSRVTYTGS